MLVSLSIRDVVLIDRLDLVPGAGLTALTGETGAGKSILLDSLGLALGDRAEAGLVRAGAAQASVAAGFAPPPGHPALALLAEHGIGAEDGIVLRRVLGADGRSRAFVNDEPVGVALLRRLGALLVEVQGQFAQVGLADEATHAGLLDAFGRLGGERARTAGAHASWRAALRALADAEASVVSARKEEEYLRHAVEELARLAPEEGEEEALDASRRRMQQGEKRAEGYAEALAALSRQRGAATALREAARALDRLPQPNDEAEPPLAAIGRAQDAVAEAEMLLERLVADSGPDPQGLERAEERLFALRAMARKHQTSVDALPALLAELRGRLAALDAGEERIAGLAAAAAAARETYRSAAEALTAARTEAASRLDRAVAKELAPLKLEKARFITEVTALPEAEWGPDGSCSVRFLVAMNPGMPPAPLARTASGGELARLMLALKVVLAAGGTVPTLVFDEVDSGIGGATAAAVGERLARLAAALQVLVVTHSPQVAAKASVQWRVAKRSGKAGTVTTVTPLGEEERREEIARMLAGERITDAARAAADSLLAAGS
ncbi:DNA repair protein RecN [Elioraea rosea]|uniref:DNA repair protein RecN n=1 Tax=Elioraea rosea TaxID=2492390 RepID=UPI0011824F02|nr:DNA repair protein RecN [Elioraea rosea]